MQKFSNLKSIPSYLSLQNIDTDMIIPKQFLKTIKRTGLGKSLFYEMRYDENGKINNDFILNKEPFVNAQILLTRDNFGCGSSREHAVWALRDFGIKIVIASSFGDIFYNNCFKNGVLPIKLDKNKIEDLFQKMSENSADLSVSLDSKKIFQNENEIYSFDVEENLLERIIYGLDDVDMTLKHKDKILAFEQTRMKNTPWIFSND